VPILFAIAEAAKALGGISPWTLRKHLASGRLRVVRIGRRVFLDAEEVERIRREGLPSLGSRARTPLKPQEISENESQPLEKEQCL
jgi:excisionase family DNA binding protein